MYRIASALLKATEKTIVSLRIADYFSVAEVLLQVKIFRGPPGRKIPRSRWSLDYLIFSSLPLVARLSDIFLAPVGRSIILLYSLPDSQVSHKKRRTECFSITF